MASQTELNLKPGPAIDLIKIEPREIGGGKIQTVNARDLWTFVESKQQFADWIKNRIEKYSFTQDVDFIVHKIMNQRNQVVSCDYFLSLDTAKELSMVENNSKGRQIRRYFIECERRVKQAQELDPIKILSDPAQMRGLLLMYTEKVIALESEVCELKPKAGALDRIAKADGSLCITDAAKNLQLRPRQLFNHLSHHHWIYRRGGRGGWIGYQDKIQSGYLEHKVASIEREDGTEKLVGSVLVTPLGLSVLAQNLNQMQLPLSGPVEEEKRVH
ncbi:MAG: hypothetical protein A2286_10525 [Gammaproteobacteria bacterium RIFOXYA12_FULL_61_12]|nr:MAG: hypothetical protein A2514_10155 [Gammaproteobacteria bacterium RIFOXYD12_FULL_61_37]OGT89763.1 MAG: hypothetical protein A2286_10525 [Gammaproteobacteria bacterium RIFOXYA12_FULL_61_12]